MADIDGDGKAEIIGPSDVHYISAFNDDGSQILTNARYNNTSTPKGTPKFWSQVGVHVDDAVDLRGYANCGTEHRPNFANSPPSIVDIDGSGVPIEFSLDGGATWAPAAIQGKGLNRPEHGESYWQPVPAQ